VNLLLDTHVLIWWATDDPKLGPNLRSLLADSNNEVAFSVISIWEVAMKHAKGLIELGPTQLRESSLQAGLRELAFLGGHAARVAELPPIHSDPFDRALVAQAMVEPMVLLSEDGWIRQYSIQVLRG